MTKVYFILSVSMLFFFIVVVTGLMTPAIEFDNPIINDFTENYNNPVQQNDSVWATLTIVPDTLSLFWVFITASSETFIFGAVILSAIGLAMIWAIAELIRGV